MCEKGEREGKGEGGLVSCWYIAIIINAIFTFQKVGKGKGKGRGGEREGKGKGD